MRKTLMLFVLLISIGTEGKSQNVSYDIYAIQFGGQRRISAKQIAVKAAEGDSVTMCYMFWLLRGTNGKNILVDVGFIDSADRRSNYVRPDRALKKLSVRSEDISDIILTHPHWDHIGGLPLFPHATVWVQKSDYEYFVGDAWQETGFSEGFEKADVQKIIDVNLSGRLKFVKGDNIEIIAGIKVFIGSKHTFESQYVLVNTNNGQDKAIIASDNIWFYYNLLNLVSIPKFTFDPDAYVREMKRMKTLVSSEKLIIPGHDAEVFNKFPKLSNGVVRISPK